MTEPDFRRRYAASAVGSATESPDNDPGRLLRCRKHGKVLELSAGEGRVFGRIALAVVVAAFAQLAAFGACADAPPKAFPPLPASMTIAGLPAWLRANTDVPAGSLVALVRGVATVLADPGAQGVGDRRTNVVVRREALTEFASDVIGGRSELVRLELDCSASRYRLTARSVYAGNSLTGPMHAIVPPATTADVPPNTDLAFLLRAVCDPAYKPPLAPYLASAPAAPPAVAAQAQTPVAQPPTPVAPPRPPAAGADCSRADGRRPTTAAPAPAAVAAQTQTPMRNRPAATGAHRAAACSGCSAAADCSPADGRRPATAAAGPDRAGGARACARTAHADPAEREVCRPGLRFRV